MRIDIFMSSRFSFSQIKSQIFKLNKLNVEKLKDLKRKFSEEFLRWFKKLFHLVEKNRIRQSNCRYKADDKRKLRREAWRNYPEEHHWWLYFAATSSLPSCRRSAGKPRRRHQGAAFIPLRPLCLPLDVGGRRNREQKPLGGIWHSQHKG